MVMTILQEIIGAIENGKGKRVKQLIERALEEGYTAREIVKEGLVPAMEAVSGKYRSEQLYIPEVIMASHAMNVGTAMLEEYAWDETENVIGSVVIGTVKGDLHNIGKNLVAMMLKGVGFKVYDLGYDVSVDTFIEKALEYDVDIICMSAMLTTTMQEMKKVTGKLKNKKLEDKFIIMVGGAPVTEAFARNIGADLYTRDAASAAKTAKETVLALREREMRSI